MEKWKLLYEYKNLTESLYEKMKFIYSEKFFSLCEEERKKFLNEKNASEAHVSALCELLWGMKKI